ncbi:hypothetical protein [Paraburkholderia nemoris]|uniref:hypothetical protein n=1 Tax=Paraburkholderia nemoris TaxID=2793076 RepID=UPI001B0F9196|nr:hypothetical protein [Paraburkholderia nemoris]CAE6828816.1 hypothetical protein LMG22931_06701 [Paraburkholderia nemoris]
MEVFTNREGYTPLQVNLAGHYAKCFSRLEQKYQGMLVDAGLTPEEWDQADVAGRRNIVAQRDYVSDPRHEAVIYFQLDVLGDDLTEMIAKARSDRASDVALALHDVDKRIRDILKTDRVREGELIQAVRAAMHGEDERSSAPHDREYVSEELAFLNQAALIFWKNAKRGDRTTHPTNSKVESWFVEHGFSESLASKAATIIRPDWASTGRPPQER